MIFHPDDRDALLRVAGKEPDLDAARLLIAIRLAVVEERQQGELWDLMEHWVEELAEVRFTVPPDAQRAIMRRALSFPDLHRSGIYLTSLFQRLYERATTPVRAFNAEVELHIRRGLGARRVAAHRASDQEVDDELDRVELRAAIRRARYRAHGATDEDVQRHEDEKLEAVRAQLAICSRRTSRRCRTRSHR